MKKVQECNGLSVGEKVKDFNAKDQNGNTVQLSDLLKKGKVVIVFYRGQWCPICMPHVKKLQKDFGKIKDKGACILLVTPENQSHIKKTVKKTHVEIPVLHDKDYQIMKAFDVNFKPTAVQRFVYNTLLGADLKNAQSDDSEILPVPATFVIDTNGTIIWRHFNRDYKKRSRVQDILELL